MVGVSTPAKYSRFGSGMILVQSQVGVTIENGWNHQKSVLAHSMDTKPPREKTTSYLLCVWQVQCWGPPNRFSSNSSLFAAKNLMENPANTACFARGLSLISDKSMSCEWRWNPIESWPKSSKMFHHFSPWKLPVKWLGKSENSGPGGPNALRRRPPSAWPWTKKNGQE